MFAHQETRELLSSLFSGENNPNYGNKWTDDQKNKMSEIAKERHRSGKYYNEDWKEKLSKSSSEQWKDLDLKNKMAEKVSNTKSTYRFYQYDKNSKQLIAIWESMSDIIKSNPTYHNIAIYSVCNGYKKSYKGFIWIKESKI